MDIFKKRCGCGAIFSPALASSRSCSTCEARSYAVMREQVKEARVRESPSYRDDAGEDECASGMLPAPKTLADHRQYQRALLDDAGPEVPDCAKAWKYTIKDLRRQAKLYAEGANGAFQGDCVEAATYAMGAHLDRLGVQLGVSRGIDVTTGTLEADDSYRAALRRAL